LLHLADDLERGPDFGVALPTPLNNSLVIRDASQPGKFPVSFAMLDPVSLRPPAHFLVVTFSRTGYCMGER
jgi:hypothetical protein